MSLESALHAFLTAALPVGSRIIRSDQDGERPAKPYVTYKIMTDEEEGHANFIPGDDEDSEDLLERKRITVSVQGFGSTARSLLASVFQALYRDDLVEAAIATGITPYLMDPATNITAVVDSGFEERWVSTLHVRYSETLVGVTEGGIETIDVTGDIGNVAFSLEVTE